MELDTEEHNESERRNDDLRITSDKTPRLRDPVLIDAKLTPKDPPKDVATHVSLIP